MTIENLRSNPSQDTESGPIGRFNENYPRISRVVWVVLILLAIAGVIWWFYPKPVVRGFGGPGGNNIQPVGVAQATLGPINITISALGTVTPLATATVKPQVSGLLTKLYFAEGQLVKAGDPLAQIDPRPYQAAVDSAAATLAGAKSTADRDAALMKQNAVAAVTNDTAQAAYLQAKANLETAEINLGYTRIVSPVTGRVGLHQTDIGNIVSASSSTIVVVTEVSPTSVLFTVPEDNIEQVIQRVASGATLSVDAYDRSQTIKLASGKLDTIDNVVDPTTGTVKMRALFDNTDGSLFPSQFVNVRLLVDTLQNQVVIPVPAVQHGADGTFVFVVTPDKIANERDVKLGVQDGNNVAITSGLAPGDTVVVDGADRLRDGADVEIPNPKAAITNPSAGAGGAAGGRGGAGGGRNNPQRAAQLAALLKTCAPDMAKLCAGQTGNEARRCLFTNASSLSSDCSAAMTKLRGAGGRGGRGGGGGGGGGGFP